MNADGAGQLSDAEVRKVASLARLALTDDDVRDARTRLSAVLGYMDRLRRLDLEGVDPLTNVGEVVNRLDADEPGPMLPTEALLRMAPRTHGPYVHLPKVIDEGGGA